MRTDNLILREGMQSLRERLGLVEAERFIALARRERFDYTEWQKPLWQDETLDDLFAKAKALGERDSSTVQE